MFNPTVDQAVTVGILGLSGLLMTVMTRPPAPPQSPEQRYERALFTLAPFSEAENAHTLLSLRDCLTPLQRAPLERSADAQAALQAAQALGQSFALPPRCPQEGAPHDLR
ncbi:hypothetical protein [Deinococcus sp. Leaf326]|uniref:hypothetical protein n=1 Tax=Deinococcus sp. Leaf326 TaxID=1736338 RepID=UPI0006F610F2|nr:hypothetical protein [Deinococcus sp. Leaf326]KQR25599.1 hypothetical protein ASF71_18875 [Deinococcus sp. Leaf326]